MREALRDFFIDWRMKVQFDHDQFGHSSWQFRLLLTKDCGNFVLQIIAMVDSLLSIDALEVNYLTDGQGKKTDVVIPINVWLEIKKLIERSTLKEELIQAFQEMQDMRNGVSPRLSLTDVINEL